MNILKFLFLFLLISVLSCKSKTATKKVVSTETKVICHPYFDFDQVEHYSIKIEEPEIWKVYEKKKKTVDEKRFIDLMLEYTPKTIVDSAILNGIEKSGYIKNKIAQSKFESINSLFCERKHISLTTTACIPFFRDILVFKRLYKTVGIAKICFTCGHSVIIGTKLNTMEFGQSGDYSKLQKLLYN